jgi:hypothetical protein
VHLGSIAVLLRGEFLWNCGYHVPLGVFIHELHIGPSDTNCALKMFVKIC